MKGTVILSHGLESGPNATKVSALARVADVLGWQSVRPDYLDIDARKDPRAIDARIARALANTPVISSIQNTIAWVESLRPSTRTAIAEIE